MIDIFNKFIYTYLFFILLSFQYGLHSEQLKIAIVDWSDISGNYVWFQEQYDKINDKRQAITAMAVAEEKEIKLLEESNRSRDLSIDAEIKKRRSELTAFMNDSKILLNKKEEQLFMESKTRIMTAIKEVAALDNISLILSKEQALYFSETTIINLTDKVLRKLNGGLKK